MRNRTPDSDACCILPPQQAEPGEPRRMAGNESGAVCRARQPRTARGRALPEYGLGTFHYVWEDSGLLSGCPKGGSGLGSS